MPQGLKNIIKQMKELLELLETFGFYLDESAPAVVKLSLYFLILSVLVLLNVINISIYLVSIYVVSNEKILSKISSRYMYIHKLLLYYKNIRIIFIIYEVIFLLICIILMISMSFGLVSFYMHYK